MLQQDIPLPLTFFNTVLRGLFVTYESMLFTITPTKLLEYNLSGLEVATLVNENKEPGNYEVSWDASQLSPGVYFYSLHSGSFKDMKKLVILK